MIRKAEEILVPVPLVATHIIDKLLPL